MKTENHMRKQIVLLLLSTMLVILIGYIFIYPDRMVTDTVVTTSYDASSSETTSKIPLENDAEWLQTLTFSESGFLDSVKMKVTEKPLKFFDPETLEKATFKIEADKLRIDVAKNNSFLLPIVHIMGYKSPVIIFLDHCCILPEGIEYIENVEMIHDHGDRSEWDQFAVELINTIDIAIEKMEANQK